MEAASVAQANDIPSVLPVSDRDIEDIFEYEEQQFPGHHATKDRLREWRDHDPSCFMCIKMPNETVMGYYILFFLKPESMQRFLSGELLEDDIRASDLIEPNANSYRKQMDAHVCCFASKRPYPLFTVELLWHLLGRIVDLGQFGCLTKIYAEATTPGGERMLRRFQFQPCQNSNYTGDPLFCVSLTPEITSQWQQWYANRSFRKA